MGAAAIVRRKETRGALVGAGPRVDGVVGGVERRDKEVDWESPVAVADPADARRPPAPMRRVHRCKVGSGLSSQSVHAAPVDVTAARTAWPIVG
jgi:hypothetical protein